MSHSTSWQRVHPWYSSLTKHKGHYFHEHVILPHVITFLKNQKTTSVLDLACGSGVLGRSLPKQVMYVGVDIAKGLLREAKQQDSHTHHVYIEGDITRPLSLKTVEHHVPNGFDTATCILALQNVKEGSHVIENAYRFLKPHGECIIVLNHPCFRIPRQSGWGIDERNKLQFRKIQRYMSALEIPIDMHPGKRGSSPVTWSYHYPLSTYTQWLKRAGFVVSHMEEWTSDKESIGKTGKMENMSRNEIPLFLCIVAKKVD